MYLAILVKTDGRISGFVTDDDKNLGISFQSQKIATNLFAIYIHSKEEFPSDYIEEKLVNIENNEHIKEIEIMRYIERYE